MLVHTLRPRHSEFAPATDLRAAGARRVVTQELDEGAKLAFLDPSTRDLRTVEILG